jgi:transcriptional regulator with XRE-family HTH domain
MWNWKLAAEVLAGNEQLSRRNLAKYCGISKSSLDHYLCGERKPPLPVLILMAQYLGVTVEELKKPTKAKSN